MTDSLATPRPADRTAVGGNYNRIVARTEHLCATCGSTIKTGDKCDFQEFRAPRHNEAEKQVGIEYCKFWYCMDCINAA